MNEKESKYIIISYFKTIHLTLKTKILNFIFLKKVLLF